MFCCDGLKSLIENAGQRGIAALVERVPGGIMVVLQSRGVAADDEPKLRPGGPGHDYKINISTSTGITFCPFCGKRVEKTIEKERVLFEELADRHDKLRTIPNLYRNNERTPER